MSQTLGLIRFKRLEDDLYYAQIEPDNNIVGLLAPHFSRGWQIKIGLYMM
jgi:hypothetical protein